MYTEGLKITFVKHIISLITTVSQLDFVEESSVFFNIPKEWTYALTVPSGVEDIF